MVFIPSLLVLEAREGGRLVQSATVAADDLPTRWASLKAWLSRSKSRTFFAHLPGKSWGFSAYRINQFCRHVEGRQKDARALCEYAYSR